jgi:hypothetical protein
MAKVIEFHVSGSFQQERKMDSAKAPWKGLPVSQAAEEVGLRRERPKPVNGVHGPGDRPLRRLTPSHDLQNAE